MAENAKVLALPPSRLVRQTVHCSKCGIRTEAKSGVCKTCQTNESLVAFPTPRAIPTERIVTYMAALRQELERRKAELASVLGEVTP